MSDPESDDLFDPDQLWFDMPEFVQESKGAIKRVTINFCTEEDIEAFNRATGLKVTMNTKGLFYPPIETSALEYK